MGPPDELAEYYARKYPLAFREDPRLSKEALAERRKRGWKVAKQAADILRQSFGAQKVVVFGSLVNGARFTPWSDVDLAAWGISDDRFYAAVAAVIELSPEFEVDLVDPSECRESIRRAIQNEGVEI